MEKLTKHDLKDPDAFISTVDQIGHIAYENRQVLIGAAAIIAVAGIAWAILGTMSSHKEDQAQTSLYTAEKKLKSEDEKFKPEPPATPEDGKATPKKEAAVPTGQLDADYKDSVPTLKDVIAKYPGTKASVVASLDLSSLYYKYKKYDDEIALLKDAAGSADHPVTRALVASNMALAYEAKGDCKSAIDQWEKVQKDPKALAFRADSLLKSALCYEKLGDTNKAADIYKRFDNAEKDARKIAETTAAGLGISLQLPMEMQSPDKVKKLQEALNKSESYQELQSLISDAQIVKSAKKYLKLIKKS